MPDLVGRLLERWSDVNQATDAGRTALDLSVYWAIRNPINATDATAIIRLLVQGGGLAGREVGEIAATVASDGGQPQVSIVADDDL